jgi:Flp pilus assembly pilin Flp
MPYPLPQLWTDDHGQDIAEYAVMLAVILVLVVGTIRLVQLSRSKQSEASNRMFVVFRDVLSPLTSGCLQPFRFVALDDDDHTRLRMAMESLLDRTSVGVASGKGPSL